MPDAQSPLTLYIGTRTYSSWSLRGWLIMETSGLDYRTEFIPLREKSVRAALDAASPGGTVPAIRHGDLAISETLAIGEYVAELAPDAGLWPEDREDRARARMLCSRMTASFANLRAECPMNLSARFDDFTPNEGVLADLKRLETLWGSVINRPNYSGPYLFGEKFGIVDAFFAPVAARIYTFRLPVSDEFHPYVQALLAHPKFSEWTTAATRERAEANEPFDTLWFDRQTYGDFPILREGL